MDNQRLNIRAVLVDDELTSRNVLRDYLLRFCDGVEVVGEGDSVATAVPVIKELKPDVVFLDVEMPRGNGFDLLEQLSEMSFDTIFVTAYDQYAIQALNWSAAYYLLKPLSIDELKLAVDKVRELRIKKVSPIPHAILLENLQRKNVRSRKLVLPMLEGFEVVNIEDIVYCAANDNFTDFHFVNKPRLMICRNLRFYEDLLHENDFMRTHKSFMINLDHVVKYNRGKGGQVTMTNGTVLPVSPQKKDLFMDWFERGR
jgi:two-component system, LytTR family, response regulator